MKSPQSKKGRGCLFNWSIRVSGSEMKQDFEDDGVR